MYPIGQSHRDFYHYAGLGHHLFWTGKGFGNQGIKVFWRGSLWGAGCSLQVSCRRGSSLPITRRCYLMWSWRIEICHVSSSNYLSSTNHLLQRIFASDFLADGDNSGDLPSTPQELRETSQLWHCPSSLQDFESNFCHSSLSGSRLLLFAL